MLILQLLVFAIPVTFAAILHMVVVKLNLLPCLNKPLDLGKTLNGARIFGDSKTFRGVVAMVILSIAGCYLLQWLAELSPAIGRLNILLFDSHHPPLYGLLYGLGYTIAELPNSFFKRRNAIPEGKRGSLLNIIIDQGDSPIGCLLFIWPFSDMDLPFIIAGSIFFVFLHMFFNFVLYLARLRKNPL